jgi:hypothetical protein
MHHDHTRVGNRVGRVDSDSDSNLGQLTQQKLLGYGLDIRSFSIRSFRITDFIRLGQIEYQIIYYRNISGFESVQIYCVRFCHLYCVLYIYIEPISWCKCLVKIH